MWFSVVAYIEKEQIHKTMALHICSDIIIWKKMRTPPSDERFAEGEKLLSDLRHARRGFCL